MFCTQCGSKNAPESKFCTNCGNPLVSVPVQPDAGQARISDDFSVDSTAVETPASQLAPQSAEQPEEQSAAQHFNNAHHCQFFHFVPGFAAFSLHSWPGNTNKAGDGRAHV